MIYLGHNINLADASLAWYDIANEFFLGKRKGRGKWGLGEISYMTYYKKLLAMGKTEINNSPNANKEDMTRLYVQIVKYYRRHFKSIILADEKELGKYKSKLKRQLGYDKAVGDIVAPVVHKCFKQMYKDFEGNSQIRSKIYDFLVAKLNVYSCPYCNRNYTFTIPSRNDKETPARPEFDHFYAESNYSFLVLSFYNLVPCCHTCNHVKGAKKTGINPYFRAFDAKFVVRDEHGKIPDKTDLLNLKANKLSIGFDSVSAEEQENITAFALDRLYALHRAYAEELFEKALAYQSDACQNLVNTFQGAGYSAQDVHDFIWGKHLEDAEYIKRPLAKLEKDILTQLGI